ncbi:MAG: RDD family protein [Acidobacteriota bacterium]
MPGKCHYCRKPTAQYCKNCGHYICKDVKCLVIFLGTYVILYFPLLEGLYGRTLGKRLFRIRVVRNGGVAIGMKEAFLLRMSMYLEILIVDSLFIPFLT